MTVARNRNWSLNRPKADSKTLNRLPHVTARDHQDGRLVPRGQQAPRRTCAAWHRHWCDGRHHAHVHRTGRHRADNGDHPGAWDEPPVRPAERRGRATDPGRRRRAGRSGLMRRRYWRLPRRSVPSRPWPQDGRAVSPRWLASLPSTWMRETSTSRAGCSSRARTSTTVTR